MAVDPVPWFIGGGAEHSPEVARLVAYAATSGNTGIVGIGDLAVSALPTPAAAVQVYPGAAVVKSTYAGATSQSYLLRNVSATRVDIPVTGSTGRTDYIIARVGDPQYTGAPPASVMDGPYTFIERVTTFTGIVHPYIVLARIVIPANTAVITSSMITSMREMANPLRKRDMRVVANLQDMSLTGTSFTDFPKVPPHPIEIPSWASRVYIRGELQAGFLNKGYCLGKFRMKFGSLTTQEQYYHFSAAENGARYAYSVSDMIVIPSSMRGTVQSLSLQGNRLGGTTGVNFLLDTYSSYLVDLEFVQAPAEDTF